MNGWQLRQRQNLPLHAKIKLSLIRIREWYEYYNGDVYVAFSGGKDSTVLLDLVRSIYPDVEALFVNTGLEFPEIVDFVKTIENVTAIRPKMSFKKVLEVEGFPVVSKVVSMAINRYRNTKDPLQKEYRKYGTKNGKYIGEAGVIPKKWHYLIDAPFKISEKCCDRLKKEPYKRFNKISVKYAYVGVMADESNNREQDYLKRGCNSFEGKYPQSRPIAFWKEQDIWEYIHLNNIGYSKIYNMGYKRTGCIFCPFGVQFEKTLNRFQLLQKTHPELHTYCMEQLGMKKVLNYLKIDTNFPRTLDEYM